MVTQQTPFRDALAGQDDEIGALLREFEARGISPGPALALSGSPQELAANLKLRLSLPDRAPAEGGPGLFDQTIGRAAGMAGRGALGVGRAIGQTPLPQIPGTAERPPESLTGLVQRALFKSPISPGVTGHLPPVVRPIVENLSSPGGLEAALYSPIRIPISVAGSAAANQIAESAGAPPAVQTAVGIAGGFAGYPEAPLGALKRVAGAGGRKLGARANVETSGIAEAPAQALEAEIAAARGKPPVPPPAPPGTPPVPPAGAVPPVPPSDPLKFLSGFIRAAKPVNEQTAQLVHEVRQRQAAMLAQARGGAVGQEGALRVQGVLRGELPRAQFEAPKNALTQPEWDGLFEQISRSQRITQFEHVPTANALRDVQNGIVPQQSQIDLLEKVFGPDFAQAVYEKGLTRKDKIINEVLGAINAPRSIQAGFDVSATLRQGSWFSTTHPKEFAGAFKAQIEVLANPETAQAIDVALRTGPAADVRSASNLYQAPLDGSLSRQEEAYMSKLAERFPGVKRSQLAYVTFLNKLRADVFDTIAASWKADGRKVTQTDFNELASYINRVSGRGSLGPLGNQGKVLSTFFYSPRFTLSRFQVAQSMLSKSPAVRQQAWRDFALYVGPRATLLGMASAAGIASVELNPTSSDFGKLRVGNLRVDLWGGWQPVVRYMAQLSTNTRKAVSTGQSEQIDRDALKGAVTTIGQFARSKLAPIPGIGADVWVGKTFVGNPVTLGPTDMANLGEPLSAITPLVAQDAMDAAQQSGWLTGVAVGTASSTGIGIQTFAETESYPIMPRIR